MRAADLDVRPDRVMLDAFVLLAATDEARAEHRDALTIRNVPLGDRARFYGLNRLSAFRGVPQHTDDRV
jgi:hypothetical protein